MFTTFECFCAIIAVIAIEVLPVTASPTINSFCPLPIGSKPSIATVPVKNGWLTSFLEYKGFASVKTDLWPKILIKSTSLPSINKFAFTSITEPKKLFKIVIENIFPVGKAFPPTFITSLVPLFTRATYAL